MQRLPQSVLDEIIDDLAGLEDLLGSRIARYSLVSKAWVKRTRKYCFKHVKFEGLDALEKWCAITTPESAGISHHIRLLDFLNIHTLEGFEEHMRAFTRVEHMRIAATCDCSLSPSVTDHLVPMGRSLTHLELVRLKTTSHAITSLLAKLPHLKDLTSWCLEVTDNIGGSNSVSRIPFFQDNNPTLVYCSDGGQQGPPNWIPPSARLCDLGIFTTYSPHTAVLLNQWFSSSCTTLTSLVIEVGVGGEC